MHLLASFFVEMFQPVVQILSKDEISGCMSMITSNASNLCGITCATLRSPSLAHVLHLSLTICSGRRSRFGEVLKNICIAFNCSYVLPII